MPACRHHEPWHDHSHPPNQETSAGCLRKYGTWCKKDRACRPGCIDLDKSTGRGVNFAMCCKLLLGMLVKTRHSDRNAVQVLPQKRWPQEHESQRHAGFHRTAWQLQRHGRSQKENMTSVGFLSKTARFFTVGASGLVVNLSVIALLTETTSLNYLFANSMGILASMTGNFLLNKVWTFRDRRFACFYVLKQYGKFILFSSGGAMLQLALAYYFVDLQHLPYYPALIVAVMIAAFGNFLLNKRFTFGEKIWS